MNKLQHLKKSKQFLRKVLNYRRNLLRRNAGKHASVNMVKTMAEIDYFLPVIVSFDRMANYLSRVTVQQNIRELIPSNKNCWKQELAELVNEGYRLKYKIGKQLELTYK